MRKPLLRRFVSLLVHVKDEEFEALLWAWAYGFCLLAGYYILRPLRETAGVAGGVKGLSNLFLATLAATLALNPLLSWLVGRFPRRRLVPWIYHGSVLQLLVFYAFLRGFEFAQSPLVARVFFVWTGVFNMFVVSIFWGFLADLFRHEQGRRLFGFIGLGCTIGAMVGAELTGYLAHLGASLLLLSALLLELAVLCIHRLVHIFRVDAGLPSAGVSLVEKQTSEQAVSPKPRGTHPLDGVARVLRSPYLLGICLFILLYALTSTFVYFEQARLVTGLRGQAERMGMFARIDFYVNLVAALCQLLLTGRLLERLGVGRTLVVLPLLTLAGFVALAILPGLGLLLVFQVLRRGTDYGVTRPAREVLFTVLAREDKYQAKNFIDTFVYRSGDAIGATIDKLLASVGEAGRLPLVALPVCVCWALLALLLGRKQAQLARHATPPAAPASVSAS